MLTKEDVKQVGILSDIHENAVDAFLDLANNMHKKILSDYGRDLKDRYDKDIFEITGVKQGEREVTHEYLKRAFSEKIGSLNKEIEKAKEKVKSDPNDKESEKAYMDLKQKYDDLEVQYSALKADTDGLKTDFDEKLAQKDAELTNFKVSSLVNSTLSKLEAKQGLETAFDELKAYRISKMMEENKAVIEIGQNGENLVKFYDKDGRILTDATRSHAPHTIESLSMKYLKDIVKESEDKAGAGSKAKRATDRSFVGEAKTKDDAYMLVSKQLAHEGVAKTDASYQEKFDSLYAEAIETIS